MVVASRSRVVVLFALAFAAAGAAACTRTIDLGETLDADGAVADASPALPDGTPSPANDAAPGDGATTTSDATSDASDAAATGPYYVFLTRAVYDANLGGLAGADGRCQSSAKAAGLTGTYRAWLSDATTDARDRILGDGPWLERKTNKVMFPTRASLTGFPEGPPQLDEYGDMADDRWWTGTAANGLRHAETCKSWSSNGQFDAGMTGTRTGTGRPGKEWTEDRGFSCVTSELQKFALLCFGPM